MNGMLQHPDVYRFEADRHQREARQWAHAGALGRFARMAREQYEDHPVRTRVLAVASPTAVALGILAIFA